MDLLSLLVLIVQRRLWKRRMVSICTIIRFFLMVLRQLHTLHVPSTALQRSFGKGFNFLPLEFVIRSTMGRSTMGVEFLVYMERSQWFFRYSWYEDYLQSLLIEEDETLEGHEFVEAVAVRKKTLFIGNLTPQTQISDIINFIKDVAAVVYCKQWW